MRGAMALFIFAPIAAAESRSADKPDLSEFRTVAAAIRTTVKPLPSAVPQIGYLGVVVSAVDGGSVRVDEVADGSPAAIAGIARGDLLASINADPVRSPESFRDAMQSHKQGDEVAFDVKRGAETLSINVSLGATSHPMHFGGRRAVLGVTIGSETQSRAAIAKITPGFPAESAGLKAGDLLVKVDNVILNGIAHLSDNLAQKQPGDVVSLIVRRDGKESEKKIQLAADPQFDQRTAQSQGLSIWKKGHYNLAVVCGEFPDVKHNPAIGREDWEESLFSRGDEYDDRNSVTGDPIHGSLHDYYYEQSLGKQRVEGRVFNWIQLSKKRAEYGQGAGVASQSPFLLESLDLLMKREGEDVLKIYDGILFIYAGDRPKIVTRGGLYWPHKALFQHKGIKWNYFICPEGGAHMTSTSLFGHEFGHMLGLPDLYARPEFPGSTGAGAWCSMSMQAGGGRPQHFSAWCKEQLGWIKPAIIDPTVKQKIILSPVEGRSSECVKVLIRPDGSEYLLLENRRKLGFDQSLPAEGLLIWRVVNNRPMLEESHGVDGPNGPMVYLGSVPYPSIANNSFTPYTTPSSRSMLGGGLPVYLTNIRKLADGRITFCVGYEYE